MLGLVLQDGLTRVRALFAPDREDFFLFVPVCLGAGIATYFSFATEPALWFVLFWIFLAVLSFYFLQASYPARYISFAFLLGVVGFATAYARTQNVRVPILERSIKSSKITAIIRTIESRPGKKWRLTLQPLKMSRLTADKFPFLIRLSARNKNITKLSPGEVIKFSAALFRPSRPSVPLGYDFARKAFFQKIGAVGYIQSKIRKGEQTQDSTFQQDFRYGVEKIRDEVTSRVMAFLPEREGALAAALLTGKRGAIEQGLYDDIRHSGLAHLLAISGLHLAVMAGTLFWLIHMLLAMSSRLALSWPIKKWAVLVAFIGATFYLFLSGAGIATQRAYIMLIIGFLAILVDRPALTLRNLALACCLILLFFPETLLEAGFQMSFATTAALISFYEYQQSLKDRNSKALEQNMMFQKASRFMVGIFMTSLIAGFAVMPFTAFHFHQMAVYSLAGNLLVMPVFVFIVMPMTLLTLILMPFGLEYIALKIMSFGLSYMIEISHYVSGWEGAVFSFPVFPTSLLVMMTAGFIILVLLKSPVRLSGLLPVMAGLLMVLRYGEPDLFIDHKIGAVALNKILQNTDSDQKQAYITSSLYHLLKFERKKSALERWLSFSNRHFIKQDLKKQDDISCDRLACIFELKGHRIAIIRHRSALYEECQKSDFLILTFALRNREEICPKPSKIITKTDLQKKGGYALRITGGRLDFITVSDVTGQRPWTYKPYKWKNRKKWKKRVRHFRPKWRKRSKTKTGHFWKKTRNDQALNFSDIGG